MVLLWCRWRQRDSVAGNGIEIGLEQPTELLMVVPNGLPTCWTQHCGGALGRVFCETQYIDCVDNSTYAFRETTFHIPLVEGHSPLKYVCHAFSASSMAL